MIIPMLPALIMDLTGSSASDATGWSTWSLFANAIMQFTNDSAAIYLRGTSLYLGGILTITGAVLVWQSLGKFGFLSNSTENSKP